VRFRCVCQMACRQCGCQESARFLLLAAARQPCNTPGLTHVGRARQRRATTRANTPCAPRQHPNTPARVHTCPPAPPPPPPQHRQLSAGDQLRVIYENLSKDPNSLANLDQVRCACTAAAIFFGGGGAQLSGVR
jgi:hypothetical protein